jgi:hypothetical protein
MKIALLLPSRERMSMRMRFILTSLSLCKSPDNFNIYMGVDKDDPTLNQLYKVSSAIKNLTIIEQPIQDSDTNIHKIWNNLAETSTEEILGLVGDDMYFVTPHWDKYILDQFNHNTENPGIGDTPEEQEMDRLRCYNNNFKLVHCFDGHRPGDMCVNAFIHRMYYETTGYFTNPIFVRNWADQWLWEIYNTFESRTYLADVHIEHDHVDFGRPDDSVNAKMIERDSDGHYSARIWKESKQQRIDEANMWAEKLKLTPNLNAIS